PGPLHKRWCCESELKPPWIKPNAIQDWLIDTQFGINSQRGAKLTSFKGLAEQQIALEKISKG
ncbi:hypothetical protein, partial [Xanthomonas oryzae]